MNYSEKARAIMRNWNKDEFIKIHHPDYMFIRETELVSLGEWTNGSPVATSPRKQKNE